MPDGRRVALPVFTVRALMILVATRAYMCDCFASPFTAFELNDLQWRPLINATTFSGNLGVAFYRARSRRCPFAHECDIDDDQRVSIPMMLVALIPAAWFTVALTSYLSSFKGFFGCVSSYLTFSCLILSDAVRLDGI